MKTALKALTLFLLAVAIWPLTTWAAFVVPEKPAGFVSDFAGMMSTEEISALESKLADFNATTTIEIAVVTIRSLDGDTIENAAQKIFDTWKIGKVKADNGALVLVSLEDRKARIQTGYGLEGALTDIQSSQIINEDITPAFRAEKYYEGLNSAVDDIILAAKGEARFSENGDNLKDSWIMKLLFSNAGWLFIFIPFLILRILAISLGRTKSWWLGGVLGAAGGGVLGLIFGSLIAAIAAIVFLTPIGLLFDYAASKGYEKWKAGGGKGPWLGGGGGFGGFGGGSHSGGGFGGFGGGRSGGGGASGGW
ncbi:MAG: uncharacterized protein LiPW15_522 [Parcubacteria group bacterium LiPW_15]|nr:MAG: uncharacterized protein LiPW15_522 [Parcubacteria group bacterium LiPW_15]